MFGGSSSSGSAALQLVWDPPISNGSSRSIALRQPWPRPNVHHEPAIGRIRGRSTMFFRTEDRRKDRSVDQSARAQRRQQLQAQQQILERERAAASGLHPAA
jgi:hypothetical protein